MNNQSMWSDIFGNPPFQPKLEVMSFLLKPRNNPIVMANRMATIEIAVKKSTTVEEATPLEAITETKPEIPVTPVSTEIPVTLDVKPAEVEVKQETGLVPVDSVTYSILNDDSKPQLKGLFKKRNKK